MKTKKYKHIDDVIDLYIALQDEQIEIPLLIEKARGKYDQHIAEHSSQVYKPGETEDIFKIFTQIKKHEERKSGLDNEITEAEKILSDFLSFLKGGKISYERKDDNNKSKITYLFWLEEGKIMSNR